MSLDQLLLQALPSKLPRESKEKASMLEIRFMPIHLSLETSLSSCLKRQLQEIKEQWANKVSKTSQHQEEEVDLVEEEEAVASEVEVEAEASEVVAEVVEEDSIEDHHQT